MRGLIWMIGLSCVAAMACDDDGSAANAGDRGDMDGGRGNVVSGGSGGTGGLSMSMGGGGTGGLVSTQGGGGTGGSDPWTCVNRPDLVPDAGSDACRACAIEHCCANPLVFHCLIDGVACTETGQFGRIQQCFAEAIASGSTEESWYIVAECAREEVGAVDEDAGMRPFVLPWSASAATELTRCVVGTLPDESDADGGVGPIREAFSGLFSDDDPRNDPYFEPACAEECFEGWR